MAKELTVHKDKFGRELKLGDWVLHARFNGCIRHNPITSICPVQVRVANSKLYYPSEVVLYPKEDIKC